MNMVLADLKHEWRMWIGVLIVLTYAGVVAGIVSINIATAATVDNPALQNGLYNHAVIYACINGVVLAAALTTVMNFMVQAQNHKFALWQFAGISPSRVRWTIIAQVVVCSLISYVVAAPLAILATDFTINVLGRISLGESAGDWPARINISYNPLYFTVALLCVIGVALICSWAAVRKAAAVQPLDLFRSPERPERRIQLVRAIIAGLFLIIFLVGRVVSFATKDGNILGIAGLALVVAYVALAPFVTAALIKVWTSAIPSRRLPSWYMASSSTRYFAIRSSSMITLIVVSGVLLGAMAGFGLFRKGDDSSAQDAYYYLLPGMATFGGPIVMLMVTAAITAFMSAPDRRRERILVEYSGGTPGISLRIAILEAVIYSITGLITSVLVIVVLLFDSPTFIYAFPVLGAACVLGFLILLAGTVLPTVSRSRAPARLV